MEALPQVVLTVLVFKPIAQAQRMQGVFGFMVPPIIDTHSALILGFTNVAFQMHMDGLNMFTLLSMVTTVSATF